MIKQLMLTAALWVPAAGAAEAVQLFDGKSFKGWEGNLKFFRIEEGAVVGGNLKTKIPNNEFLCPASPPPQPAAPAAPRRV